MSSDIISGYTAYNLVFIAYFEYFIQTETLTSFFCAVLEHNVNVIIFCNLISEGPKEIFWVHEVKTMELEQVAQSDSVQ